MQWINEPNFSNKKLRVGLICFQYRYIKNMNYRYKQMGSLKKKYICCMVLDVNLITHGCSSSHLYTINHGQILPITYTCNSMIGDSMFCYLYCIILRCLCLRYLFLSLRVYTTLWSLPLSGSRVSKEGSGIPVPLVVT